MDSPTLAKKPPPLLLPFSGATADKEEEDREGEGEAERATVPPPRSSGQPRSSDPPCPRRREGNEARGVRRTGAGAEEGEAVSSHGRVGAGRGAHSGGAVVRAPEAAAAGARQCAPEAAAARAPTRRRQRPAGRRTGTTLELEKGCVAAAEGAAPIGGGGGPAYTLLEEAVGSGGELLERVEDRRVHERGERCGEGGAAGGGGGRRGGAAPPRAGRARARVGAGRWGEERKVREGRRR